MVLTFGISGRLSGCCSISMRSGFGRDSGSDVVVVRLRSRSQAATRFRRFAITIASSLFHECCSTWKERINRSERERGKTCELNIYFEMAKRIKLCKLKLCIVSSWIILMCHLAEDICHWSYNERHYNFYFRFFAVFVKLLHKNLMECSMKCSAIKRLLIISFGQTISVIVTTSVS